MALNYEWSERLRLITSSSALTDVGGSLHFFYMSVYTGVRNAK